ncbi:MAG: ABC transporter substrate-binding protein [Actinomycetes bacterium]
MNENEIQRELGQHLVEQVANGKMTRRELLVRGSVLGLSLTTLGSLLAACGGSTAASSSPSTAASVAPKAGGTLRVAMVPPTSGLDPVVMYDAGAIATVQQVCEYLIWVENDLSLRPVLAESWSPDASAKTWTFKLRQNVTFSNGQPFTADDVVATFKRLTDPKAGSSALSNFQGILSSAGVRKVDASTVEFGLDRAFVDFPYLVSSTNYDAVILPSNYAGDFQKNPVGTGPFVMTSFTAQQNAKFKKNPTYWQKGLPYLDGLAFTYANDQAQTLDLQSGSQDLQLSTPYQGSQALLSDPAIKIASTPSTQMREVQMRVDKAPFDKKEFRQAIAYSLDRPALLKGLFAGKGTLGNDNVFSPLYPIGVSIPQRAQDYAKAKQLLTTAGLPSGTTVTLVAEQYLEIPQYATLIQSMCKPAGIDVKIEIQSQTQYYGKDQSAPWLTVPFGITDWAGRAVPSQFFLPMLTSNGVYNSSHWKNPQFDSLAKQYDATIDVASRRQIGVQMATLETDETPVIIAYWIETLRAMSNKVHNVKADGSEFLDLTTAFIA